MYHCNAVGVQYFRRNCHWRDFLDIDQCDHRKGKRKEDQRFDVCADAAVYLKVYFPIRKESKAAVILVDNSPFYERK